MGKTTWIDEIELSVYQSLNHFMDVVLEGHGRAVGT